MKETTGLAVSRGRRDVRLVKRKRLFKIVHGRPTRSLKVAVLSQYDPDTGDGHVRQTSDIKANISQINKCRSTNLTALRI